jgi:glycosyltransferase involved in cell wall biosynthesis
MKILHVIPGLTWERGGPSVIVEALARHQAKAGHSVAVLTTDQGFKKGEQPVRLAENVDTQQVRVLGPDRFAYAPAFRREARARIRESDLVHVHSIFTYPVHVAYREALAAGIPLVLRPCGILHRYSLRRSPWRKRAYLAAWGGTLRRACTAWHYTSEKESTESWPWDSSFRFVLPNGIEPEDYALSRTEARAMVRHTWPQLGGSPYVLYLGRLHPKKRVDLLLEAFLAGAPRRFKLLVAGPDECGLWEGLAARFLQKASPERVVRVQTVAGLKKIALLAGASLFALPSEHENFGNAALEALAAGTPVLLSPHVDLAEAVTAAGLGETAALDVASWRDRFSALLLEGEVRADFAESSRQWVSDHYSWAKTVTQLTEHYRIVCRSPRCGYARLLTGASVSERFSTIASNNCTFPCVASLVF